MDIMTINRTILTMMIQVALISYPSVQGSVGPDDYELYHDLHGPDDSGVYCVSRG